MNEYNIARILDAYTTIAINSHNMDIAIKLNWYSNAFKSGQIELDDVFESILNLVIHNR